MLTNRAEESSDEEVQISEISTKVQVCSIKEENFSRKYVPKLCQTINTNNQSVFFYNCDDTVEDAFKFNKNLPVDCNDPFIIKLRVVLKQCPSIKVQPEKNTRVPFNTSKRQCPRPFSQEEPFTLSEQTRTVSFERTCNSENNGFGSSEALSSFSKLDINHGRNEYHMSEASKDKFKNLVHNLCSAGNSIFYGLFLEHKKEFLELLAQIDVIQETIPQIIEVILKIFEIEHPLKQSILISIIHNDFIRKLVSYITLLPTDNEQFSESEIEKQFLSILLLCESMVKTVPVPSAEVVRKILLSMQYSVKGFKEIQNFNLEINLCTKINMLLKSSNTQKIKVSRIGNEEIQSQKEPRGNIKEIDIFPTKKDLLEPDRFLTKNVVNGPYRDVNHYIDVHFRLLREDFIAPLRSGIRLYLESITKENAGEVQQFDNIRIHEGVRILHGTITNGRLGHLVQLVTKTGFSRDAKRFIFGSLVLFTADNFESFICGTVINPTGENFLIVELHSDEVSLDQVYGKDLTMVESEVYFEPYFHVLTALKEFDCAQFPMKEYIVDVKMNEKEDKVQDFEIGYPTSLNESQRRAFVSATSNEFVVIQGPPGTGKTYLAEQIVKQLLRDDDWSDRYDNIYFEQINHRELMSDEEKDWLFYCDPPCEYKSNHVIERDTKPILVVCYTNHALDQFLERLLDYTKELIRVGGQSKNPSIQDYNIKVIRKSWMKTQTFIHRHCKSFSCKSKLWKFDEYFRYMERVKSSTFCYLVCLQIKEFIGLDGLVKAENLKDWMSPGLYNLLYKQKQYESWLMEGAYVLHLEGEGHKNDLKSESKKVHTQQLLSEFRESNAYWDDLDMYKLGSVHEKSSAEAASCFFVTCSEIASKKRKLQSKLRKCQQKGENENVINSFENEIENLEKQRRYITHMLTHKTPVDLKRIKELNRKPNIWAIDFEDRWMLYNYWVQQYENEISNKMHDLERDLKLKERQFIKIRDKFDLQLLKSARVLGMTTTCTARLREMLIEVGPEIVIVEEAAEVLESHVLVALNPNVKKIVLIGDHKQLKPSPAVYELAVRYNLDVSLFERMVNNGLACHVLDTQHRMRPEIASLIVPAIYPDLKNGEKALNRPDIRGVASNIFFVTHNEFEDEYYGDGRSHRNTHEVDFLMSLCEYLLKQEYRHSQITILTTYLGQMTALENERRRRYLPSNLRIATVDNYQGEENDIILLSLVRSNSEAKIGFLSAENRVCVALSRAKNGLYIIGNMDNLTQGNTVWRQVKARLVAMDAIGPALPLGCKHHKNDVSLVSCGKDFEAVPLSGCKLRCGAELMCGHECPEVCHSCDLDHTGKFACPRPCERMSCEEHRCTKTCGRECGPCSVKIEKQLPCGHSVQVKCSTDPESVSCVERVTLTSDVCGHIVTKYCYEKKAHCYEPCTDKLDCGHLCTLSCWEHVKRGNFYHKNMPCSVKVEKSLTCGHTYKINCSQSKTHVLCTEPCSRMLPCGHPCSKLCGETCANKCETMVEKTLTPCGHEVRLPCSSEAVSSHCRQPCPLTLPCGHPCPGTCSADCSSFNCQEMVVCSIVPACGHQLITIPCHLNISDLSATSDLLLQHCQAPCRADLACGHVCVGRCGPCLQGRLHIPCSYPCTRTLNCGHNCEGECRDECPAFCESPCSYQCPHKACDLLCGDPCTPCQRKCERKCSHQQCSRVCGDKCDCPPCDEPCPLTLPCGHTCRGFCGEPCLKYCVICHPQIFDIPGHASKPTDRYVSLANCRHPIEEGLLIKLIKTGKCEIKKCPICEQPIRFVERFKDVIRLLHARLAILKAEENMKYMNFEEKMKTEKHALKYSETTDWLENYGENAFIIWEHLKKAPPVYKTTMRVLTFFKTLTKSNKFTIGKDEPNNTIIQRRKLLLAALSLRLKSMSSSDYNELLTEIFCLELASKGWPKRSRLLSSLKKYSLDELKALE